MSTEFKLPGIPEDQNPEPGKIDEPSDELAMRYAEELFGIVRGVGDASDSKIDEPTDEQAMRFADEVMGIVRATGDVSRPDHIQRAIKATGIDKAVLKTAFSNIHDGEALLWYMEHLHGLGQSLDVDDLFEWTTVGAFPAFIYEEKKRCDAAAGN